MNASSEPGTLSASAGPPDTPSASSEQSTLSTSAGAGTPSSAAEQVAPATESENP